MRGTIQQRGSSWHIRAHVGRDSTGKKRYVSRTVHGTRKDTEKELSWLLVVAAENVPSGDAFTTAASASTTSWRHTAVSTPATSAAISSCGRMREVRREEHEHRDPRSTEAPAGMVQARLLACPPVAAPAQRWALPLDPGQQTWLGCPAPQHHRRSSTAYELNVARGVDRDDASGLRICVVIAHDHVATDPHHDAGAGIGLADPQTAGCRSCP